MRKRERNEGGDREMREGEREMRERERGKNLFVNPPMSQTFLTCRCNGLLI